MGRRGDETEPLRRNALMSDWEAIRIRRGPALPVGLRPAGLPRRGSRDRSRGQGCPCSSRRVAVADQATPTPAPASGTPGKVDRAADVRRHGRWPYVIHDSFVLNGSQHKPSGEGTSTVAAGKERLGDETRLPAARRCVVERVRVGKAGWDHRAARRRGSRVLTYVTQRPMLMAIQDWYRRPGTRGSLRAAALSPVGSSEPDVSSVSSQLAAPTRRRWSTT